MLCVGSFKHAHFQRLISQPENDVFTLSMQRKIYYSKLKGHVIFAKMMPFKAGLLRCDLKLNHVISLKLSHIIIFCVVFDPQFSIITMQ